MNKIELNSFEAENSITLLFNSPSAQFFYIKHERFYFGFPSGRPCSFNRKEPLHCSEGISYFLTKQATLWQLQWNFKIILEYNIKTTFRRKTHTKIKITPLQSESSLVFWNLTSVVIAIFFLLDYGSVKKKYQKNLAITTEVKFQKTTFFAPDNRSKFWWNEW